MPDDRYFDPKARIAEKQRQRDQDDADLASGARTAEEIQRANSFSAGLDLVNAKVHVPNTSAWDEPMPSETLAYHETKRGLIAALNAGFKAGLSHEQVAEILRDLADDVASGACARDPWGPNDSRPPELREAILEAEKTQRRRRKRSW